MRTGNYRHPHARRNSAVTMLFADLVDSTAPFSSIAPKIYCTVVGRYPE
ncbi:hypothetical protein [Mycobacterium sp. E2479]|nr:hypothetical protein [Mycobacterium sp. E2479]